MNTLLNYPGAKWGMAREIVALIQMGEKTYMDS